MPFRFKVLRSGSKGNVTFIQTPELALLIDCGVAHIDRLLQEQGLCDISQIGGILVTHAHNDHVMSTPLRLAATHRIPLYLHEETFRRIQSVMGARGRKALEELDGQGLVRLFTAGRRIHRLPGGLRIFEHPVPHGLHKKPVYCSSYIIRYERSGVRYRLGYATDLMEVPPQLKKALSRCDAIILEANHEPCRLDGSIHAKNSVNHLSNDKAGRALAEIISRRGGRTRLWVVVLAHISSTYNDPDTAIAGVTGHVSHLKPVKIIHAPALEATQWFRIWPVKKDAG
jgi:phosphoribosyl 1,2-cyclic phosphodiesterase